MSRRAWIGVGVVCVVALVAGIGVGRLWAPGGDAARPASSAATSAQGAPADRAAAEPAVWTCSMHPQIRQPEPGDCPICGMDLIPLEEDGAEDDGPRTMTMSESARALAEIRTAVVTRELPVARVRLVGKLDYDETREKSLTARFPARIDRLFVNYTGVRVKPGEHMAEVYSPDLLTAQRELLTAYRSDPDSSITRVAREKLRLWDLLPDQIDAIVASGEVRERVELRAPVGGVVVAKFVNEGDYIDTGEALYRIVDLSELWLELEAYESDLTWLRYGQDVSFAVEALPGEDFHGRISFIEPEVTRDTRTSSVRVDVPNPDGRLKPGMFARATVEARMTEGGRVYEPELAGKWISPMHPEIIKDGPGACDVCGMDLVPAEELGYAPSPDPSAPLVIPASAALRTGKRAVVYVELPGRDRPTFEGREVALGPRAGDRFIVESGLAEGERVVTNGAFKIDSALQIQAKPSMMNPAPDEAPREADSTVPGKRVADIPEPVLAPVVASYLAIQEALASDDLDAARAAAREALPAIGREGPVGDLFATLADIDSIDGFRRPHFETLSIAVIAAVRAHPEAVEGPLYVMHCPMVYPDRGADWLQASKGLRNPYFGAMMLRCGEVEETLGGARGGHEGHEH